MDEQLKALLEGINTLKSGQEEIPVSTSPVPVTASTVSVKLSTYDGKTNWERRSHRNTADSSRLNLNSLYNALDLRFIQKYSNDYAPLQMKTRLQKTGESLQEYASEVERLANLAFSEHPATVGSHSVRGARVTTDAPCESPWRKEIEKLIKEIQNLMAQHQNLRRRRITCWRCGGAGHLRSSCPRINKEDHNIKCWRCGRVEHSKRKFGVIDPVVRQVTTPSTSTLDPWSDESVRKDQLTDPEIKPIKELKESSGEKPSWQDIAPFHPTTKRYWALWNSLHLRNGVLYRNWESDDGKTSRWQLILPKTRVSTVLKELHGSPTGGHFGVMKALQNVRERFYWNNVRSDEEKCCRICDPCAPRKGPRKRTRVRLQLYNVGAPFERIALTS
ncbi:retrovirus-related Pol polyprotein from transposon 412 [Trichonephila clavipes]|nr:retrovirus-related Pol polyprotein from transposon 412 [Trichonephila clavipes]